MRRSEKGKRNQRNLLRNNFQTGPLIPAFQERKKEKRHEGNRVEGKNKFIR